MRKSIIVAASQNGVISKDGELPWHLPGDLKRFKALTMGHTLIMGRKTYESLPAKVRPLPGRTTIALKRWLPDGPLQQLPKHTDNLKWMHAIDTAFAFAEMRGEDEIFVCGGGEVYREALPLVDRVYLTVVERDFEGDTFFPFVGRERVGALTYAWPVTQSAGGAEWQNVTTLHVNNENGTRSADSAELPYRFEIWDRVR